ncbi:NitT/TauT family transport system ATP-binding protein [Micromonospora profundi]|uniref:ABC transporter ATP-binding protein n=1 Tax=Micromonospora profundi TaxID=1420889 RepID=UPI001438E870|nr:ABC transporter ATP-binding protein [Micromonospora profundi]NJC13753.1 NitT/TauT family transport system ATP-binding protein [Micromonospora profundi]
MPDRSTLLRVEHLRKVYESTTGDVEAIGDISFTMDAGQLVCIVGPSGCGKTTLLKCLAGLLRPTGGVVEMDGSPVTGPSPAMAVVFQEYGRSLYPWLTVRGNVELPLRHKKLSRTQRNQLVVDALDAVGLAHAARSHPWQLSGGMQQRVAIARALAYQPEILIMDEPFAAVDAQTRADLEDLVRELHTNREISVLFVTHDIDESVYLGQRVLVLSASPTHVQEDIVVDLPAERDQITTRALPRFTELRTHVYDQIQRAKRGQPVAPGTTP